MDMTTIIVVALLFGLCSEYFKYKTKLKKLDMESGESRGANQADEVRELKERIIVLERIVTDKGYTLEREIEAL